MDTHKNSNRASTNVYFKARKLIRTKFLQAAAAAAAHNEFIPKSPSVKQEQST